MKKLLTLLAITAGLVVSANKASYAQTNSATATATATIVIPITISKTVDISFGNIVTSAASGTVELSAAASAVRTAGGGVAFPPTQNGTVTAAAFTVNGGANYTYSITLPATASLTGPGTAMTASSFTSSPSLIGTLSAGGAETLYVGATLAVGANQTAGVYTTAAPFSVTVNYN
jgi:hypothetical protein